MEKRAAPLIIFILISLWQINLVHAQDTIGSVGIATYYTISGNHIEDGDIISATQKGNDLSTIAYDEQVIGVITSKPAIGLKPGSMQKGYPVVTIGIVAAKVSGSAGNIKRGDPVTTSTIPGVGMKATRSGYVIGEAQQDATFSSSKDIKLIPVRVDIHLLQLNSRISNSLFDIFRLGTIATYEEPLRVFQYITAAFVLLSSFVFGFLIFARSINTGIQALGRNPLAGRMIQLSIVFNVVLVVIIVLTGVGIAYLLLRL